MWWLKMKTYSYANGFRDALSSESNVLLPSTQAEGDEVDPLIDPEIAKAGGEQ
jgi:hypothetical protein